MSAKCISRAAISMSASIRREAWTMLRSSQAIQSRLTRAPSFAWGQVYFDGLPDRAAATLLKTWKLKPGDIYDANYPPEFLQKTAPQEVGQAGGSYHSATIKPEVDATKLIVNPHIQFR